MCWIYPVIEFFKPLEVDFYLYNVVQRVRKSKLNVGSGKREVILVKKAIVWDGVMLATFDGGEIISVRIS